MMFRNLRLAGLHVALAAMVLRALLPAGWMPGPAHGALFVICTAEGGIVHHAPGNPLDKADRDHQICPFAAGAHAAVAANTIAISVPSGIIRFVRPTRAIARIEIAFAPYSSRAPPALV
jgi:hypothetical protein